MNKCNSTILSYSKGNDLLNKIERLINHKSFLAFKKAIELIVKRDVERAKKLQVGFLALNKKGKFGTYAIHKGFTYSVKSQGIEKVFGAESYFK